LRTNGKHVARKGRRCWFDEWARTGNATVKQRILDYNEDDCVAMRVLLEGIKKLPVRRSPD